MLSENIHSYYDYHGHFNFLPMSSLILTLIFVSSENIKKVKFAILKVLYLLLIRYQIEKTANICFVFHRRRCGSSLGCKNKFIRSIFIGSLEQTQLLVAIGEQRKSRWRGELSSQIKLRYHYRVSFFY